MDLAESNEELDLVTKSEAAKMLRVSLRTIDRYIAEGQLDARKLSPRAVRIKRSAVINFSYTPAKKRDAAGVAA